MVILIVTRETFQMSEAALRQNIIIYAPPPSSCVLITAVCQSRGNVTDMLTVWMIVMKQIVSTAILFLPLAMIYFAKISLYFIVIVLFIH